MLKSTIIGLDVANAFIKMVFDGGSMCYYNTIKKIENKEMNGGLATYSEYPVFGYEGNDYLIGIPGAFGSGGINIGRYSGKQYKKEVLFAVSQVVKEHNEKVIIFAGVPCYHYDADKIINDLKRNLKGKHEVVVDNVRKKFEIVEVMVMGQPMGTMVSKFFGIDGDEIYQKVLDKIMMQTHLIIDHGWGTTDFILFNLAEGGVIKYDTIPIGMKEVTSKIENAISKKRPDLMIKDYYESKYKLDQDLQSGVLVIGQQRFMADSIKKEVHKGHSDEVKQRCLNSGFKLDYIIVHTGGGAAAMSDALTEEMGGTVEEDSQMANANGYYISGKQQQ